MSQQVISKVKRPPKGVLAIRLDPADIAEFERLAALRGYERVSQYIRPVLKAHLQAVRRKR